MPATRRSAVLPPESTAVATARELVRATLLSWAVPAARAADAVLLTSELVASAVVHAGTEIELNCALDAGRLRVEICDLLPTEPHDANGMLKLAHALSDGWGVTYTRTTKTVWFELAVPVPAESQEGKQAQPAYRSWLGFLAEAGDLLAGTLDETPVLAIAAQLYVPRIATWCAIYLDDESGTGRLRQVWHADERHLSALRAALEKAGDPRPYRPRGTRDWPGLAALGPEERAVCGAQVMELQLARRDQRIGTLLLGGPGNGDLGPEPVRLAEDLGERVALALLTARRYGEQATANQVLQRSLLPSRMPRIPGIDYDIVYAPAGRGAAAGGDFYDLFAAGPGRWRFMLGDVAGTGPEAAAVTGLARHTLRALAREGHSPAAALDRLNETIMEDGPGRMLTVLHGELEPDGANGARLAVTAAGHPLPLLLRADGKVSAVGESQLLLGAVREGSYRLDETRLEPGDLLLCVTDGITERRHGGRLLDDDDGLARIVSGCAGMTARAVTARVRAAVRDFTPEPPDDDMAILALNVTPGT